MIKHDVAPVTLGPAGAGDKPHTTPLTPVPNSPERQQRSMNASAGTRLSGAVRREQLSDEVAARLRAEIMTGALRPDTFIRLDETAAQLGVSITPVREALRTLRGEGMVQLEPHRGHVVVPLTRADVEDIFWLQSTIARELATSATARITDEDIDGLDRLTDILAGGIGQRRLLRRDGVARG